LINPGHAVRFYRSHEFTDAERSRGGLVRLVRLYRRKLREQEQEFSTILIGRSRS
jgi:hypothetical protein